MMIVFSIKWRNNGRRFSHHSEYSPSQSRTGLASPQALVPVSARNIFFLN